MNNFEKIKQMNIDEMSEFIYQNLDNIVTYETFTVRSGIYKEQKNIAKQWLNSEVEE